MFDTKVKERLEAALRSHDLRGLAEELRSEGQSQAAIYVLFESFMQVLRQEGREADEDALGDALDFMVGWCGRNLLWFDPLVTADEIEEFRRTHCQEQGPPNK